MADTTVDSIILELETTTDKADGGIDKITKALTSMKKVSEGLDANKISEFVNVVKSLGGIGESLQTAASGMRGIASSVKSLSGVDTSKLKEIADTVREVGTALGNLGSNNQISVRIDSEGAQHISQPLSNTNATAEAQQAVEGLAEAQNRAASDANILAQQQRMAQSAMSEAAASADQLSEAENRAGAAGQSAAAGQQSFNASLNRTNVSSANSKIQALIAQINRYKATVSGMESGKVAFDTSQYVEAANGLRQVQDQFRRFKESVVETPKTMDDVAKSISAIGNAARQCGLGSFASILSNIATILPSIETGGMLANAGFQSMAAGLQAIQTAIPIIGIILTILTSIINVVNQITNAVKNAVQKVVAATKTVVNKIRSGVSAVINKFKELKKSVRASLGFSEKQAGSFAKKLGSIVRLGTFMLLRSAFTQLFELIKNVFNNLVVYSKKSGTEFSKNVNLLYNDIRQLGNSMATAFEPIINAITPLLDALIQKLITATNALAQFFSALTGKSFYTKAIKQNKDYAASVSGASKAVKNLTADMDELHILNDDNGGGGGSNDVDGSGFETDEVAEKYKNLADMIKTAWETGDFFAVGKMLGDKLAETLANIPWDEIKAQARKLGKSLATLINGFIRGEFDGKSVAWWIGHTLAESINTAFESLKEFVRDLDWANIGLAIVDSFKGFLGSLDWATICGTFTSAAQGIAQMFRVVFSSTETWAAAGDAIRLAINTILWSIRTLIAGFPFEGFGESIATFLGNALLINLPGLATTVTMFINGAFESLLSFAETFPFEELATSITTAISKLFGEGGIDWESIRTSIGTISTKLGGFLNDIFTDISIEDIGTSFGELLNTIFTGIGDFFGEINFEEVGSHIAGAINNAINTVDWENAGEAINSMITGICRLVNAVLTEVNWTELMEGVSTALSEVNWETLLSTVFEVFASMWTFKRVFKGITFNEVAEDIVSALQGGAETILGKILYIGNYIVQGIIQGMSTAILGADIIGIFETITETVKELFGINSPSKVFSEIGGYLVDGLIGGITEKFTDCKNAVIGWVDKVKGWFKGDDSEEGVNENTWSQYGSDIVSGFGNKVSTTYETVKGNVTTWATSVKDWFNNSSFGGVNKETFTTYADDVINGFKDKIANTYATTKSSITTWTSSLKDWFSGSSHGGINSTTWSTYASNVINGFKNKITNAYSTTKSSITTWSTSVKNWFTENCSYTKFYNIAADVISGFKNGIGALYHTCKDNIESWGSSIISWFKEKLDSHSPSKVFIGIGEDTVKGFNLGIEDEGTKTKGIMSSWADSFTDMDINLGTRLRINDSALKDYQNNYGSDFTNEAIVQRVTREVSTNGAVQATLNSGGGLKEAIKEALDELGIAAGVGEISQNTKTQADKKEQTIVEIGGRTVTEAVVRQRSRDGFSFQPT